MFIVAETQLNRSCCWLQSVHRRLSGNSAYRTSDTFSSCRLTDTQKQISEKANLLPYRFSTLSNSIPAVSSLL
jgi:hypothetical protein